MQLPEKEILNAMPVIGMLLDREARLLYVNPHFVKATGFSEKQALGQSFFNLLVLESDREEAKKVFREIINEDLPDRKTGPTLTANGDLILVEWCGAPAASGNVTLIGYELKAARNEPSRFKEILDSLPANIVLLDRDARIMEINALPLDSAGVRHSDVVGRPFIDQPWLEKDTEKHRFRRLFELALSGRTATDDFTLRFGNNERIVAGAFAPILRNGAIEAIVGFGTDITERRQAEDSARRAQATLEEVVSGAPIVLFVVDSLGRMINCQGDAWHFLGPPEDLIGKGIDEVFAGFSVWKNATEKAMNGARTTVEAEIGGRIFELTVIPSTDEESSRFRVTGVGFDVTHRKASERRVQQLNRELETRVLLRTKDLEESEDRFRQIAENVRDVFFLAKPDLTGIRYLSPSFEDLWGESPQSYLNHDASLVRRVHPADRSRVQEAVNRSVLDDSPFQLEFRIKRLDEEERWIRLRTFHLPGSAEPEVAGVAEDITDAVRDRMELVASREKADRANRAKSEFTARISHELRTPLNAILGFVQVLIRKLGAEHQDDLKEVKDAGQHLLSLMDDLLDISRVETDQLAIASENLSVDRLISRASRYLTNRAGRKSQEMVIGSDSDLWVLGDKTRIVQVLINLLSNASKYTPPGGKISIFATKLPESIRIHVQDTGPGISESNMQRLFLPFERLGDGDRTGVGLGLYLSRVLAQKMRGNLGVNSTEGAGSDFWLELPRGLPEEMEQEPSRRSYRTDRDLDILYIEDNPVNLKVMESLFRTVDGAKFRGVDNAREGILEVQKEAPNVILIDMHLADCTGYDVLQKLQQLPGLDGIPRIAVSADAMEGHIQAALAAGFSGYVCKPVELEELLDCIDGLLSSW